MKNIELNKNQRKIMGVFFLMVVSSLFFFGYQPLIGKIRITVFELNAMEEELVHIREVVDRESHLRGQGRLLKLGETPLVINEITQIGEAYNIDFVSLNPREIEESEESWYKLLPISMGLEAAFQDLALFLGALRDLEKGVVTIRSFQISRDTKMYPVLKATVVIDMYLQGT